MIRNGGGRVTDDVIRCRPGLKGRDKGPGWARCACSLAGAPLPPGCRPPPAAGGLPVPPLSQQRTAGLARAPPAHCRRRSLIVCQDVLHCDTILVIHHTDCEPCLNLLGKGRARQRQVAAGGLPAAAARCAASSRKQPDLPPAGGAHAALFNPTAVVEHTKAKIDEALGTHLGGALLPQLGCTAGLGWTAQGSGGMGEVQQAAVGRCPGVPLPLAPAATPLAARHGTPGCLASSRLCPACPAALAPPSRHQHAPNIRSGSVCAGRLHQAARRKARQAGHRWAAGTEGWP